MSSINWERTTIDLGLVQPKANIRMVFKSFKELDIVKTKAGCGGCTTVKKYINNELPVIYTVDTIPKHLKHKDYKVRKTIIVYYGNGEQEVLTFTATIKS